jgi:hypothetical protein
MPDKSGSTAIGPAMKGRCSRFRALKATPHTPRPIYHVTVVGVHLGGASVATDVRHLPVSAQTLDISVTRLHLGNVEFPKPDEGIAEWRRAKGGVFTISVADIIEFVDQRFRSQSGSSSPPQPDPK